MIHANELPPVVDNDDEHRFELVVDGQMSELTYRRQGDRLELIHTGVPDSLSGRGIGSALVKAAIARAVADHLTVVPTCPFARAWLERHLPDVESVTIDWRARGNGLPA